MPVIKVTPFSHPAEVAKGTNTAKDDEERKEQGKELVPKGTEGMWQT